MPDPFLILGIEPDADDAAVEAAYRSAIKRCPPDREPVAFQAVREAYERLRTRRDRIGYRLFDTEPPQPIDLLRRAEANRHAVASAGEATERANRRPDPELFKALLRGER
ncbi:DnaJ domain-containing protein [Lamprobacter modestohalophilus]|uniref:DnaJ domain-containing protein n=1 Tax=Lamprobacter modestohalophilus TaxID=1064514 RepID=UPI002ADEE93D|nr:DnaJ domain-containing protein [Lamprobacter modestohalophilus]MEA1049424.1 DnaJ domain-containing protein [Lamprobacter modestohalophilus]